MPRLSLAFFTVGGLCGLTGMLWGIQMAATQNFTLAPAHAHLNLLGWVTLSLMGGFYALAGARAPIRIGWINFALSVVGVIIAIPALAHLLLGDKGAERFVQVGTSIVVLGMVTFLVSVLSLWAKPKAA